MKKITITNAFKVTTKVRHSELKDVFAEGTEEMDASDGYHTFTELYDHRIALFIALSNSIEPMGNAVAWKSKLHSDGTSWDGWFIAGINQEKGQQISYHLPMDKWDYLHSEVLEKAPEWDGHTPADVVERLLKL